MLSQHDSVFLFKNTFLYNIKLKLPPSPSPIILHFTLYPLLSIYMLPLTCNTCNAVYCTGHRGEEP
jgi:hypothetical protein